MEFSHQVHAVPQLRLQCVFGDMGTKDALRDHWDVKALDPNSAVVDETARSKINALTACKFGTIDFWSLAL